MSRDDSTLPPTSKTTWLARTPTESESASVACAIRASSCSARAGTLASKEPSSALSSVVSLTDSRYESVATMRNS